MNALEVLKAHFVGKKIVGGNLHPSNWGKVILDVQVHTYEPILEFTVKDGDKTEIIDVLFDWEVDVAIVGA